MTFFRREADRLDSYLDDRVAGHSADPDADGLDPTLIDTWTWATTAMAHTPSDPDAKADTWRTLMHARSTAAALPAAKLIPPLPRYDDVVNKRWSHRLTALAGTAVLAASLVAGFAGYERFGGGGSPNEPTAIPAAALLDPGTPQPSGCTIAPRASDAIAQIMATPQSQQPYLPRFNSDPVYQLSQSGAQVIEGSFLLMNSSPDESETASIHQMLERVVDCVPYALGPTGQPDLTGRYFANFSDDFFRRELSGYAEAGLEPQLITSWIPPNPLLIEQVRKLADGERYLVVLAQPKSAPDRVPVVIVVPDGSGGWQIDEVGYITPESLIAGGTPISEVSTPEPASDDAAAVGISGTSAIDRYPHQVTMAVSDLAAANADPRICGATEGTSVACMGNGIYSIGPWFYNEIPASLPFTFTFVNTSDITTQITSPELGIDIAVPAGQQVDVEVDAAPGMYEIDFTQGDATSSWTFQFEPQDGRFSMG